MSLISSFALGYLIGHVLFVGITLEQYKLANWNSRIIMLCAVILLAELIARTFS